MSCECILSLKEVDLHLKLEAVLFFDHPSPAQYSGDSISNCKINQTSLIDSNVNLKFLSQLPGVLLQLLTQN